MFIDLVYAQNDENGIARLFVAPPFSAIKEGDLVTARESVWQVLSSCTVDSESDVYNLIMCMEHGADIWNISGKVVLLKWDEEVEENAF